MICIPNTFHFVIAVRQIRFTNFYSKMILKAIITMVALAGIFVNANSSKGVIDPPVIQNTIYVDGQNGRDWKDGSTEATALKTLQKAMKTAKSQTQIIVMDGEYKNYNYGNGINNPTVFTMSDKTDILLTNYPGHKPVIKFDGAGGISMNKVSRVEITGFEIVGPNKDITKKEAMADRLLHSKKFSGRGIAIWSGA